MNFAIEHVGVPASDTVALKNWYVRMLSARQLWDSGQKPPTFLLALAGDVGLEIYPAHTASDASRGGRELAGFAHLALRVASIDAAKAELEKRGVRFTEEIRPAAGGGKVLFFEDGEGNLLHLVERSEEFMIGDL